LRAPERIDSQLIRHVKQSLVNTIKNLFGWRTSRRLVAVESDDWGSIRMPSRAVYQQMRQNGLRVDRCPYCRFDSLASVDDLNYLFDLLSSFADVNGRHPVITANSVVANPDFDKIEASGFREYHYEPFTRTLERYPAHGGAFEIWQQGMAAGVFHPQFHGREHLNVGRWMNALRQGMPETRLAFRQRLFGISTDITSEKRPSYMAAFDPDNAKDISRHKTIIEEGLDLFQKTFQFGPESFVPPNGILHPDLEPLLASGGIRQIQSGFLAFIPRDKGGYRKAIRYQGQQSPAGIHYTIRNCQFEPSTQNGIDWVDRCLSQVTAAFKWKKPAIINMHRLNFIGWIDPANRDGNLRLFRDLLRNILKKWPDVEFVTSDQVGAMMRGDA
jgi:hypothetical protein